MITYGLTPQGFVAKPLSIVLDEIDAALKNGPLGQSAGTEPDGSIPLDSLAGQLKVILADMEAAQWDLLEALQAAFDPNQATSEAQDALCSITGTQREPAQFSTVVGTCTGDNGTVILPGKVASVNIANSRFDVVAPGGTIASLAAWQTTHAYLIGNRVANGTRSYICITSGTSAGSGGPTGILTDITDGTVHWKYLGEGTAAVDVHFEAEVAGPIKAVAGTLANIATPVSGWRTVVNLLDAAVGASVETDAHLRARRDAELAAPGNATVEAIRANILGVNQGSSDPNHQPVTSCTVFYNDTDVTDADGLPPHSVEVLALGGTDQDIANAVWLSVGGGIQTFGNQTSTMTDSQGNPQTVYWSRPTPVNIYIVTTVYYDPSKWPASGAAAAVVQYMLSALLTLTHDFPISQSVRSTYLSAACFEGPAAVDTTGAAVAPAPAGSAPAPGILDASPFYIGTAPSPGSGATIAIGRRQIAAFDSSRIAITATPEAP